MKELFHMKSIVHYIPEPLCNPPYKPGRLQASWISLLCLAMSLLVVDPAFAAKGQKANLAQTRGVTCVLLDADGNIQKSKTEKNAHLLVDNKNRTGAVASEKRKDKDKKLCVRFDFTETVSIEKVVVTRRYPQEDWQYIDRFQVYVGDEPDDLERVKVFEDFPKDFENKKDGEIAISLPEGTKGRFLQVDAEQDAHPDHLRIILMEIAVVGPTEEAQRILDQTSDAPKPEKAKRKTSLPKPPGKEEKGAFNAEQMKIVQAAGNAKLDADRLRLLEELAKRQDLDEALRIDLELLMPTVKKWAESNRGEANLAKILSPWKKPRYARQLNSSSPLFPIEAIYRARQWIWVPIQIGRIFNDEEDWKKRFANKALSDLKAAQRAFPENPIVNMYLGEPIPWPKEYPDVDAAPEWANLQRRSLEGIADIVEWWIDNRLYVGNTGEFGAGIGDDCEMWRWWAPVLLGFESPKIVEAQEHFSEAVMSLDYMKKGFMQMMRDVEHSSEDSADTVTPMMSLKPDDPKWLERGKAHAGFMKKVWQGKNERGFWQFKSTYISANKVDNDPQYACDTPYHARAVQSAFVAWLRTGDKDLEEPLTDWMKTWVDATRRAESGKPAGIIPAAIHWPDGKPTGLGENWWLPENTEGNQRLYQWPHAMALLTDALVLTWHMTGDDLYLEPVHSMARIYRENRGKSAEPEKGSLEWCANQMYFIRGTLAKYRLLSGDTQYDDILSSLPKEAENTKGWGITPYSRYYVTNNLDAFLPTLKDSSDAVRQNFEGYTSEVRYTDRVLKLPERWFSRLFPEYGKAPDTELLFNSTTGNVGAHFVFPMNGVRWLTPPREIAALVKDSGHGRFEADLFHYGKTEREMGAELYLLPTGEYAWKIQNASGKSMQQGTVTVEGARTRFAFRLPSGNLCTLSVEPE